MTETSRARLTVAGRNQHLAHGALVAAIRLGLGLEPDLVLWQNGVAGGQVWVPETGSVRHFHAGLPRGSSDLIGGLTLDVVLCNQAYQKIRIARLFCIEAKTGAGKPRPEQLDFLSLVRQFGGFAAVVRSVEEARAALLRARAGELQ